MSQMLEYKMYCVLGYWKKERNTEIKKLGETLIKGRALHWSKKEDVIVGF